VLPKAGNNLPGRVREQGRLVPIGLSKGAGDVIGLMNCVGVSEEEVTSAGCLRACPAGVALACESTVTAQVQRRSVKENDAVVAGGCMSRDRASIVSRVVVDDDQLPLLAEGKSGFGLS